jgi:alkylation response protein AidB-like acyl-CoA dehydrogenase
MTAEVLRQRLAEVCGESLPLPAHGRTRERFTRLMEAGREDLSLAKLAEAHWDAVAILAEAGHEASPGAIYAVWASEIPGRALQLEVKGDAWRVIGAKPFCSGAGLVDRALVSAGEQMVEVDLRGEPERVSADRSAWVTEAFRQTCTSTVTFEGVRAEPVGEPGWYVGREGFWHGACGVAACWAGGAQALVDWAMRSKREDAHTLAHLGAMQADVWAMQAALAAAAQEMDAAPEDRSAAEVRALMLRHTVEQACMDVLRRFGRSYGPHPLAMDAEASRRVQELELYLRQTHGERDLESLGRVLRARGADSR